MKLRIEMAVLLALWLLGFASSVAFVLDAF